MYQLDKLKDQSERLLNNDWLAANVRCKDVLAMIRAIEYFEEHCDDPKLIDFVSNTLDGIYNQ